MTSAAHARLDTRVVPRRRRRVRALGTPARRARPRSRSAATAPQSPGTIAARTTSCVLTMRTASLRRVHRLGVRAHHRVAEQQQHQRRRDHDAAACSRRTRVRGRCAPGDAVASPAPARCARDSMCRLAPTEPFIGASSAPTPSADSSPTPRWLRANSRSPARCKLGGERQPVEQRADECVERQRLQQVVLEQADDAVGQGAQQRPVSNAPAVDAERRERGGHVPSSTRVDRQAASRRSRRSRPRTWRRRTAHPAIASLRRCRDASARGAVSAAALSAAITSASSHAAQTDRRSRRGLKVSGNASSASTDRQSVRHR